MDVCSVVPANLSEALVYIDDTWPDMREELIEHGPVAYHSTMGMHLRNIFGLWYKSPLAQHLEKHWGVSHPDDMSGLLLEQWVTWLKKAKPALPWEPGYVPPWVEPPTCLTLATEIALS